MAFSRRFHSAYTARIWRFHGVLFILQRSRGVCKALSRRSLRSHAASTASYGPGPDSVMVRAFASEAGGAGSNLGHVIPKTLQMVPVATLLGAQH